ncbi:hypothetical protein ACFXJO_12305 [Streptomyces lavendulae]|uniref:hypothetical protein n=1 Tax=Streptomyces lavendulae TaxID=1914 RepID=UPI00369096BC
MQPEEGQNFRKAGSFGPMAGHVNGAICLNPDSAAYARACGAEGYKVEPLSEFEEAFRTG